MPTPPDPIRTAVVVGNPKADSRTLAAALAVADTIDEAIGISDRLVIDLATLGSAILDWQATDVNQLNAAVAESQVLVVASPTYKATYTGLLKVFLDRYGDNGMAGTVAVPLMTGAAPVHALAPELHLRPLLTELGASVPTRSIFLTEAQLHDVPAAITPWGETALPILSRFLGTPLSPSHAPRDDQEML